MAASRKPPICPGPTLAHVQQPLFDLSTKRALVTGGSSGIGKAMARALGQAGAQVSIVARNSGRIDQTVAEFGALGIDAHGMSQDLTNLDSGTARELTEGIDILVNAAGVNHRPPLAETTPEQVTETMAVNLMAPYHLGQAAGPAMAERGWGRIINIGSQQTWMAFGNSGVYGVSKAGVGGLSRSQSEAWARFGVTANTVIPGFVVTPMTAATVAVPGVEERLAARHHIGRNGVPEDFEGIAVFLASPSSAFVTGQMIAVDGGFSVY